MAQKKLIALPDIAYASNSFQQERIPTLERIKAIHLFLTGSRTTTTYTSDGGVGGAAQDNPLTAIKNVEVVADGITLQAFDFRGLYYQDYFMNGTPGLKTGIALTGAAVTGQAFSALASIYFIQRRSIAPIDTVLDASRYRNIFLRIQWGDYDDINPSAANATEVIDATTKVQAVVESTTGLKGVGGAAGPWISKRSWEEVEVSASSTNFRFALQPSNALLRAIMVRHVDEAATLSVPTDGFNEHNIKINNDQDWVRAVPDEIQEQLNKSQLGLETQATGGQPITGYRHFDFAQEGLIRSQSMRENVASSIDYVFDITNGGNQNLVRVYRDEILLR